VRADASQWNLDPRRIGMVGFSAGGEVISMVAYSPADGDASATDPIDRVSCRPDFQILIYPGPLGIPEMLPPIAPPAFFLVANDDASHVRPITNLLENIAAQNRRLKCTSSRVAGMASTWEVVPNSNDQQLATPDGRLDG
jgi:acetyl esterase/lipase